MSPRRSFVVEEDLRLPGIDPAAVWALVADLGRLEEWTPLERVDWAGDLPRPEQAFTGRGRLGPLRRRLTFRVEEWEAGRWYRIRVEGLPLLREADLWVEVEIERPDAPRVIIREGGSAPRPFVPLFRSIARSWARRSLEGLHRVADWPLHEEDQR